MYSAGRRVSWHGKATGACWPINGILLFVTRGVMGGAVRDRPQAIASGGVLGRDVILQVLDSFFLLRDNPLYQVAD